MKSTRVENDLIPSPTLQLKQRTWKSTRVENDLIPSKAIDTRVPASEVYAGGE